MNKTKNDCNGAVEFAQPILVVAAGLQLDAVLTVLARCPQWKEFTVAVKAFACNKKSICKDLFPSSSFAC